MINELNAHNVKLFQQIHGSLASLEIVTQITFLIYSN